MDRHQIGRRRRGLFEDPGRLAAARADVASDAARDDRVRLVRRHREAIGRLVGGDVVAGEPGRRSRGLSRDEGAVLEFLPADGAPARAARARCAGVRDGDLESAAGDQGGGEGDPELPIALVEARDARARDGHLRRPQAHQVEGEHLGVADGATADRRGPAQAVRADLVVQRQRVVVDPEIRVTALGRVRSGPHAALRLIRAHLDRTPRPDRVAAPPAADRDGFAAHHQGGGTDGRVRADVRRREDHAVRAERRARSEGDRVDAHHPIMEQMRLDHTSAIDRRAVSERDQVRLGQPVAVGPDASADLRAQRAQPHRERGRSGRRIREPGRGDHLGERVGHFRPPHEARPERMLAGADRTDEEPLRDGRDHRGDRSGAAAARRRRAGSPQPAPTRRSARRA